MFVDIDDDLHMLVRKFVNKKENEVEYPSIKNFIDKAIKSRLYDVMNNED